VPHCPVIIKFCPSKAYLRASSCSGVNILVRKLSGCDARLVKNVRLNYKVKTTCFNTYMHRLASSFVYNGLFTFWRKIYIAQLVSYIYIILPQHLHFHYCSLFMSKIHTTDCEIMQPFKWSAHVSKMTIFTYNGANSVIIMNAIILNIIHYTAMVVVPQWMLEEYARL
jgi:hypothetical protein